MNGIEPYPLWIGYDAESHDYPRLLDAGVEAVINLAAEEAPTVTPRGLISCRFPVADGAGNRPELLALAARTVAALVAAKVPTLVSCGAGMSRSPAVVAAALALVLGESPDGCLKRIGLHHRHDVAPRLWADLLEALALRPDSPPGRG